MAIPEWPASLPQELLMDGYSQGLPDNLMRVDMDIGPAKTRRRATSAVEPVSGQMLMSAAQVATLGNFYLNTLLGGSLRFSWHRPEDNSVAAEFRFASPPTTAMRGGYFDVSLSLEILP